jgi:hypothetical protein
MNKANRNIQKRVRGENKIEKQRERASRRFVELQQKIMRCLQEMDSELLLVFKVMDYISSIDNKLGRPVNNYYYTAKYSFLNTRSHTESWWQYFSVSFYLYRTLFIFKVYEYLLRFGLLS